MNAGDAEAGAAGVEADLHYLVPGSRINRRYVAPGAEMNTGQYAPHRVKIRNARPFQHRLGFDSHGFVLVPHVSRIADFTDRAQVDTNYAAEVSDLVRSETGASLVLPMGWMIRSSGELPAASQQPAGYTHQGGTQPPASDVHVDMAPDRAQRFAKMLYEKHVPRRRRVPAVRRHELLARILRTAAGLAARHLRRQQRRSGRGGQEHDGHRRCTARERRDSR